MTTVILAACAGACPLSMGAMMFFMSRGKRGNRAGEQREEP